MGAAEDVEARQRVGEYWDRRAGRAPWSRARARTDGAQEPRCRVVPPCATPDGRRAGSRLRHPVPDLSRQRCRVELGLACLHTITVSTVLSHDEGRRSRNSVTPARAADSLKGQGRDVRPCSPAFTGGTVVHHRREVAVSIKSAPLEAAAAPQAWLRYRGKAAIIEATGVIDGRAENSLLALAASAASRGTTTVVLNLSRARLDDCSIPVLARLRESLEKSEVAFALAGPSRDARDLLARAGDELDLLLYPSVPSPPPWSSRPGITTSYLERSAW